MQRKLFVMTLTKTVHKDSRKHVKCHTFLGVWFEGIKHETNEAWSK